MEGCTINVNHVLLTSIDGLHAVRPRDVAARHHPGGQGGAGELPAQLVACKGGRDGMMDQHQQEWTVFVVHFHSPKPRF